MGKNLEEMKGSFDAWWIKQERAHYSRTGHGTLVGLETGKCLDNETKKYILQKTL